MKSVLIIACFVVAALASHGRFGTIKFTKSAADPQTVTFTFSAVFRRTYWNPAPNAGSTIYDANFAWGDGGSIQIPLLVGSINAAEDWVFVSWTGSHRYTGAGSFTVGWSSCCRIAALNNNAGRNYAFTALLKLTSQEIAKTVNVNNSPVSGMLPIVPVPFNVTPFTYQIVASDPDRDVLTYSMATATQQGDVGVATHPAGLSVNSATGLVTLTSRLAVGFWSTQQIVTDSFGNWISIDYMLNVQPARRYCNTANCTIISDIECSTDLDCSSCQATCIQAAPRLITNPDSGVDLPKSNKPTPLNQQSFNRNIGQQVVVDFVADDANLVNPTNPVEIYQSNIPTGAVMSVQTYCNAAIGCTCTGCNGKSQYRNLTWTPTANDVGSNTICVGVKSIANFLPYAQHCITINVLAAPITSGEMTTKPLTTKPLTTQPLTTGDVTTGDITTQPLTTQPLTTGDITTGAMTTREVTSQEITSQELTTGDITTGDITTQPLTTGDITTQPLTTGDITTQPLTTGDITTGDITTQPLTTGDITTQPLTTKPLTTQPLTTKPLTTKPLTTDFRTVADRCATFTQFQTMPETQGWFCSADHRGYYQCLKGPWATQARLQNCPSGTTCKCDYGVECLSLMGAVCTYGAYVGTSSATPVV